MQDLFQIVQTRCFRLCHHADRDAGPLRDDIRDHLFCDLRTHHPSSLSRLQTLFQFFLNLGDIRMDLPCSRQITLHQRLFLILFQFCKKTRIGCPDTLFRQSERCLGTGFVHDINSLIRKEAVLDIPF